MDNEKDRTSRNEYDTKLGINAYSTEEPYYLNIELYGEGDNEPIIVIPEDPESSKPEESSKPNEQSDKPKPEEPSNPVKPHNPASFIDTVLTGDNSYLLCIYFGLIVLVSCILLAIGGKLDEKINKDKK